MCGAGLKDAFGCKYLSITATEYGLNQGASGVFYNQAVSYYLYDTMDLNAAQYTVVRGFAFVPWQIKALMGLLADTVPIRGSHRTPYIIGTAALGVVALIVLAAIDGGHQTMGGAAILFFLVNLSVAFPDVIARVAPVHSHTVPLPYHTVQCTFH